MSTTTGQTKPSQDPNVLARLHRIVQHTKIEVPLLSGVEEEELVVPNLVEEFHQAIRENTWRLEELAEEIVRERGEVGLLEALAIPARQGDLDAYLLKRVLSLRPEILDRFAGMDADTDVILAVVPAVARTAFENRRPLDRSVLLDKLLGTSLPAYLAVGLVTELDEEYGRDNFTGSLRFDQVVTLAERYESEPSFQARLRALLTQDATMLLLGKGTLGAARLAYQVGTLTEDVSKTIVALCSEPKVLLDLYGRVTSERASKTLEKVLVEAVTGLVAEQPQEVLKAVVSTSFRFGTLHEELLRNVPLDEDLVVACLDRVGVTPVRRWAAGSLKANPFSIAAAERWARMQIPTRRVEDIIVDSAENSPLIRVMIRNVEGMGTLLTKALNLGGNEDLALKVLPFVAEILGENEDLWKRLIDADESSPYGNVKLTFPKATQVYLDRWTQKAKRTQA